MNLDKLLKKLEINKNTENEQKTYPLEIGGETYEVKTLNREKKREIGFLIYDNMDFKTRKVDLSVVTKKMIPTIYYSLGLKDLALRAKENNLIVKYYDVVELLFEPQELMEIVAFIMEINGISEKQTDEDVEAIKKQ